MTKNQIIHSYVNFLFRKGTIKHRHGEIYDLKFTILCNCEINIDIGLDLIRVDLEITDQIMQFTGIDDYNHIEWQMAVWASNRIEKYNLKKKR